MTIEQWGAIGELVGGFAVIVSLLYVAIQLRQTSRAMQRNLQMAQLAALESSANSANRLREQLYLHADAAELFLRGSQDFDALGTVDKFRFEMAMRNMFSAAQVAFVRIKTVEEDDARLDGVGDIVDSLVVRPGIRAWLEVSEVDWRADFRTFVKQRVQAVDARSSEGSA